MTNYTAKNTNNIITLTTMNVFYLKRFRLKQSYH